MRKTLLLLVLLFSSCLFLRSEAQATDTLTLGQVYDFAVGDTFDYQIYESNPSIPAGQTSYYRYVIAGKAFTPGGDSIIYQRKRLYPTPAIDTVRCNGIDVPLYQYCINTGCMSFSYFMSGISTWDSIYNSFPGNVPGVNQKQTYEKGLGFTSYYSFATGSGASYSMDLIFYTKGTTHAGKAYYEQPNGLMEIADTHILLYPSPATKILHLLFPAKQQSTHLILTDLIGQDIYSSSITENETMHDISHLPSGIYTYRIVSDNTTIKTGKIVKQ